jgi:hypothetical protein
MKARKLLFVPTSVAVLAVAPSAFAGQASFSLTPVPIRGMMPDSTSYFVLDSRPGRTIVEHAKLMNNGSATGRVRVYSVDAVTGRTSGAVYRGPRLVRRDVGAWISLRTTSIRLRPGQSRIIRFLVRVPRRARPGDHLGGLVAESIRVDTAQDVRGSRVRLRVRVRRLSIAAVLVHLPGGACNVAIGGVGASGRNGLQYLDVRLRNTRERLTKGSGVLVVRTASGHPVARRTFALDTLVPRTAIAYPVLLPRVLAVGPYRATVSLAACSAGRRIGTSQAYVLGVSSLAARRTTRMFGFSVSRSQRARVEAGRSPGASTPSTGSLPPKASAGHGGGIGSAFSRVLEPAVLGAGAAIALVALGLPAFFLVGRRPRPMRIREDDDHLA